MNYQGLNDAQVAESRCLHGENVLTPVKRDPLWKQFLRGFKDPLIVILLVALSLSVGIAIYEAYIDADHSFKPFFEPVGIFVAIFLATGLSFWFEMKANKEFAILNQVNDEEPVQVWRNGAVTQIPRKDVVVGDIVVVNTGDEIPADGRLLEAASMSVDESTLTGEPSCMKTTDESHFDPEATYRSDTLMRGTKVMEGHGVYEVTAVGDNTENGKVFKESQIDNSVKTPLNEQLDRLGRMVSISSYVIAAIIVMGRMVMYFTHHAQFDWLDFIQYALQTLMIAVTLVVVAVPEGLPMAVTLSLAYSMRRMLRTNNLVRKMHACETMGATTVICTDKTGTLTQNRMQVYKADFYGLPSDPGDSALSGGIVEEGIAANSTAQLDFSDPAKPQVLGNPTEGALLLWLRDNGVDYARVKKGLTVLDELPFTTERKYMATVVESAVIKDADGRAARVAYVKGAPEIVLGMCRSLPEGVTREDIDARLLGYQNQAMRTLGFAYQVLGEGEDVIVDNAFIGKNLTFLGITAISDPVRSDVPEAVREVLDAGVKVKIVTGDTPAIAREIGRQIGLWTAADSDANIVTGADIAAMSDDELERRVADIKIIARARPMDKKRLVEALQRNNEVVAVTGDGTNDAPALKAAHVGLSMGDGTSVAKEASDITIIDNSFSSIGRAVMWGRSLYRNLQRFIMFQLTVNVCACLIVLAGAFMGMESPLTVTQMLWVNLIMDTFAAMALASLPPSEDVMRDKPRSRKSFIITPAMWRRIVGMGVGFFIILFAVLSFFQHAVAAGPDAESIISLVKSGLGGFHELTAYELSLFFTFFVFLQFWNMFNARAFGTGRSALHLKECSGFLTIAFVILVGQFVIVTCGYGFFNVVPLRWSDWLIIISGTSIVFWAGELFRVMHRRH
ncbi:MAG: calcium-translocating P-type ATPase, PMCA-type [Muribaculaceae bacterium]|nr:calcium-translocating P-type ATPase, PMCA-type [Muribaculaceae bacterium]